jgi:hypothetical protein
MRTIVVKPTCTKPNHDVNLQGISEWAKELAGELRDVVLLEGAEVTIEKLAHTLNENKECKLVVFYGHGLADRLLAHDCNKNHDAQDPVIQTSGKTVLPREMAHRNLYTFACHAGRELGPALRSVKCAFIGYTGEPFAFDDLDDDFGIREEFKRIVNKAAVQWASGADKVEVFLSLKRDWGELRERFKSASVAEAFRSRENGFKILAALCALSLQDHLYTN